MDGVCADCGHDGKLHARDRCQPCYWRAKHDSAKTSLASSVAASPDRGGSALSSLHPSRSAAQAAHSEALPALRSGAPPRRPRSLHRVLSTRSADRRRLGPRRRSTRRALPGMVRRVRRLAARALRTSAPSAPRRRCRYAGIERPVALIAAVSDGGRSGRSPGDAARLLEAFLVARGLVLASDERGRLLTADARAGSSAAHRRCAPRPSDTSRGCRPVANAPAGSASTRSPITRSSSASRSSRGSPRTWTAPASPTRRRARAVTSSSSSPRVAIAASDWRRCATSSASPARHGSASRTQPRVSRTEPPAGSAAALSPARACCARRA